METGALTNHFDVAELALALFVLFFIALVIYLQRESNREGFPLIDHAGNAMASTGLTGIPEVKTFVLPRGEFAYAPRAEVPEVLGAAVSAGFPGAPLDPVGNKLTSGLGPAAYASRADVPDRQHFTGAPRIVPLRADGSISIALESIDPRGLPVLGADGVAAGTVADIWVDRTEMILRYLEVALPGGRNVLVPSTMADIQASGVVVQSVLAAQFADVPGTKVVNEVTALEEDRITAYFGGGTLYATAARSEPLL
jgi:photosynthetic reaction center H subunit